MAESVVIVVPADLWPRRADWEGKLVAVLKNEGDSVARGDPVAEVETEKAILVVESTVDGVVEEILARPGVAVRPGTPLLRVRTGGESQAQGQART